jgi:FkbM family methyltransferase
MNISIIGIDGNMRTVEISKAMEEHWKIPMNHAKTILDQINSGMYERWFKDKKDLVCMDFGANVGLVSLYMLPACKKLYCIEPTPSHYALMMELLFANCGETVVSLSDFALTGSEGEVTFATGHATENKVSSPDGYGSIKITVMGKPLSIFVDNAMGVVDFCKIDIEGGEMKAITVDELKKVREKVKTFFVEVHPAFGGGMDGNREELLKRFNEAGYKTEVIDYQTLVAYEG